MDLKAKALSRLAWQYRDATKMRDWVAILPAIAQDELEDPLQRIADLLEVDSTSGIMLDVVGEIVGQGRDYRQFFDSYSRRWGVEGYQFGASDTFFTNTARTLAQEVDDANYRTLIKARIGRNNSDATINGIVRATKFFVDTDAVEVNDYEDMTFEVQFGTSISPEARFILRNFDVVPRPQGVRFIGFLEPVSNTNWGTSQFGTYEDEQFGGLIYERNY